MSATRLSLALIFLTITSATHSQQPSQADLLAQHQHLLQAPFLSASSWHMDLASAKTAAAAEGKLILAYFTRSYCHSGPCRKVEADTLTSTQFVALQQSHVLLCHFLAFDWIGRS